MRRAPRLLLAASLLVLPALSGCTWFDGGNPRPEAYVSDDVYTHWIIEVDYVEGHRPSNAALSLLKDRMNGVVSKDSITVQLADSGRIPSDPDGYWTDRDIEALTRYRDAADTADTITTFVTYLDGHHAADREQDNAVLGITYGGLERVAIFDQTIKDSTSSLLSGFSAQEVERAVLVHEFGHVIGLVNNGIPMVRDHEDKDHPHHSNNPRSVMFWAVETTDILTRFLSGSDIPTSFDSDDKADLCAAGGACP